MALQPQIPAFEVQLINSSPVGIATHSSTLIQCRECNVGDFIEVMVKNIAFIDINGKKTDAYRFLICSACGNAKGLGLVAYVIQKKVKYAVDLSAVTSSIASLCECGASKCGHQDFSPGHSSWCPMFGNAKIEPEDVVAQVRASKKMRHKYMICSYAAVQKKP